MMHRLIGLWALGIWGLGSVSAQNWDLIEINERYAGDNEAYQSLEARQRAAEAACDAADAAYYDVLRDYNSISWRYERGDVEADSLDDLVMLYEESEAYYDTLAERYGAHLEAYNDMVKRHNKTLQRKARWNATRQIDTTAWMIMYLDDMVPHLEKATRMHHEMADSRHLSRRYMLRLIELLTPEKVLAKRRAQAAKAKARTEAKAEEEALKAAAKAAKAAQKGSSAEAKAAQKAEAAEAKAKAQREKAEAKLRAKRDKANAKVQAKTAKPKEKKPPKVKQRKAKKSPKKAGATLFTPKIKALS